jgi:hypothetical protein
VEPEPDWDVETAVVNGKTLKYNPDWLLSLSADERVAILAHEVMHCSNAHHVRREGREVGDWNAACGMAVNPLLRDAGFSLPSDVLYPSHYGLDEGRQSTCGAVTLWTNRSKLPGSSPRSLAIWAAWAVAIFHSASCCRSPASSWAPSSTPPQPPGSSLPTCSGLKSGISR